MQRRSFLGASLAAGAATVSSSVEAAEPTRKGADLFELKHYSLKPGKRPLLDSYLNRAYLPALKRLGIGPVGVFEDIGDSLRVFVLVVHPSAESVVTLPGKLAEDAEYREAAADYLKAPASNPVYLRIVSSLLAGIEGMPRLEKPDTSKPRLLNLRVYESHNERAARKKIEMFNKGEIAIFRRVGLTPVFFASALVGPALPNLTYMLAFPDEAGRAAAWARFRDDAEWNKLRAIPEYADKEIVLRIANLVLRPTDYSEV